LVALGVTVALLLWNSRNLARFYRPPAFNLDFGLFWRIQAVFVLAGLAFAVATRFPYPRSRYGWSRLFIAAVAIVPAVHFWYVLDVSTGTRFLSESYWFDDIPFVVWPLLAGVAVGSGFGARRSAGTGGSDSVSEP
jgi:hypothetical protein